MIYPRAFVLLSVFSSFFCSIKLVAGCAEASSLEDVVAYAQGAFEGRVISSFTRPDASGRIRTHAILKVESALKGTFPSMIEVSHSGGIYGSEALYDSRYQQLEAFVEGILLVRINKERVEPLSFTGLGDSDQQELRDALLASSDGADFTAFGVTGSVPLETTFNGLLGGASPARFINADRGQRISVVADVSALPNGISQAQALAALQESLDVWAAVSSIDFKIEGTANFGKSAADLGLDDEKLYTQLGDPFGEIDDQDLTLGIGGRRFDVDLGSGGEIAGQAFNRTRYGYVVLDHAKSSMENLSTFKEVLTHEIGHALGLAHSSETGNETDPLKAEAVMYYQAHKDDRGATLGNYDIDIIRSIHPVDNTPPFGLSFSVIQVSSPQNLNANGINDWNLAGSDLQGDSLTVSLLDKFEGSATVELPGGNVVRFNDNQIGFSDADASGSSFYARAVLQFSDGVNKSPSFEVRVVSIRRDSGSDGLPDSWVNTHFGGNAPSPSADADGDGITNSQEFRWGLDPNQPDTLITFGSYDGNSISFSGLASIPYSIEVSSDLDSWRHHDVFTLDSSSSVEVDARRSSSPKSFYRISVIE